MKFGLVSDNDPFDELDVLVGWVISYIYIYIRIVYIDIGEYATQLYRD